MSHGLFDRLLDTNNGAPVTSAEQQLRGCLNSIFEERNNVERIVVAGQLIEFSRLIQTALATVRREATVYARTTMSPGEIAEATGLSRATVSRLITEYRNV